MVLFVNETKGKPSDCRAAQAPAAAPSQLSRF